MTLRISTTLGLLCTLPFLAPFAFGQAGTIDLGAAMPRAPVYDSAANLDRRPAGVTTPEDNARPGEAFFNKGVEAFKDGQFDFAVEMYQVAASWAYKPAEYNLGVMYAKGQGVTVDLPRALAWMTLAAERGSRRYERARDAVHQSMTSDQIARADDVLRELKATYADEIALTRAKARWREVRNSATGSRVGFVGNLAVGADKATGSGQLTADMKVSSVGKTSSDLTNGNQVDGSIVYRQLRESDNPYDPKFRQATGTATVGPLLPDKADEAATPKKSADEQDD
ncbi:MAG TPA: sel1 repeat family protein [Rhodanobacteraceae bacterium]|nr:sel1 repeat family protein [Rhodanobacteraceae bacterium]